MDSGLKALQDAQYFFSDDDSIEIVDPMGDAEDQHHFNFDCNTYILLEN